MKKSIILIILSIILVAKPALSDSVTICNQVWMTMNLDVDHYRNGDPIPEVTDPTAWAALKTGAWCYYNNDPANELIYGKLYNWYAVNDPRGLAPEGWHVPTDAEWTELETCLGGSSVAGGKLKSTGTKEAGDGLWSSPNTGATNESGFSARPGGSRFGDGSFGDIGNYGYWWSSAELNSTSAWYRYLFYNYASVSRSSVSKGNGFSVRCVRDDTSKTLNFYKITPDSAYIGDEVALTGTGFGAIKDTNYVAFRGAHASNYTTWSDTLIRVRVPMGSSTGKVSVTFNGTKSNELDFKVRNLKMPDTVKICNQVWMSRNLDVDHYRNGDPIPEVTDQSQWDNLTSGAWCYYENNSGNDTTYSKLYNWYAITDSRGLAPIGWHVPTDSEWTELETCLGGSSVVGGKLKSTDIWNTPNIKATNESGFSALPGGSRLRSYSGTFSGIGLYGAWWSTTVYDSPRAWVRYMYDNDSTVGRTFDDRVRGMSVRCIKDAPANSINLFKISPDSAFISDEVTLTGTGFGAIKDTNFVAFRGAHASNYTSWSDTLITVRVPMGASTGKVSVTVNDTKSNELDFKVRNLKMPDTVKICNQVWMTMNLDVDHYRNGDPIPEVTDPVAWAALKTGAWCYYNNDPVLGVIYGKLYNWYAVNDPRGLAPIGWHVPTDVEWTELENCLGGSSVAGGKLKSTGTKEAGDGLWYSPNTGATNESGFSALPGGYRNINGTFDNIGFHGDWWSSSEDYTTYPWFRYLTDEYAIVYRSYYYKESGLSIRCIRDDKPNTLNLLNITPDSAYIGDEVTLTGTGFDSIKDTNFVAFRGAHASNYTSWSDTLIKVRVPMGSSTGKVSVTVNGIKSNELDFKVRNLKMPDTVRICNQVWMSKNLDVDTYRNGDPIPEVTDPTAWAALKTGAWCYHNNDPAKELIYGKLYNWHAVNDPRGLAPVGWHIPSDAEWKELEMCLGMTQSQADNRGFRGTDQGGRIKSTGTVEDGNGLWFSPNTRATNLTGFSALPGGYRFSSSSFNNVGYFCNLWTSTEFGKSDAFYRYLYYDNSSILRDYSGKEDGFSVRCIKGDTNKPIMILEALNNITSSFINVPITEQRTGKILLRNKSIVPVRFDSIKFASPMPQFYFMTVNQTLQRDIPAMDSIDFDIGYSPMIVENGYINLGIYTNSPLQPMIPIRIDYSSIDPSSSCTTNVSFHSEAIDPASFKGSYVDISLDLVEADTNFISSCKPDSVSASIRLLKTLFLPKTDKYTDSSEWRIIVVNRSVNNVKSGDKLISIPGTVLLGDTSQTPVYVEKLFWKPGTISSTVTNGVLALKNIQYNGIVPRLLVFNKIIIKSIFPNPTDNNISLNIIAKQDETIELEFYNTLGNQMGSRIYKIQTGESTINYDLPMNVSTGSYRLLIKTNNQSENTIINVIR